VVEAVDIFTGGGIGQTGAIGTIYKKAVPIDEQLEHELSKLLVLFVFVFSAYFFLKGVVPIDEQLEHVSVETRGMCPKC
jgi:hypothetical protein